MLSGPLPDYPFLDDHDRLTDRRHDDVFLAQAWADTSSRVLVMRGTRLAVQPDRTALRFVSPGDVGQCQPMLLGKRDDAVHFLVLEPERDEPTDDNAEPAFADLRSLGMRLTPSDAGLAVHAVALCGWHRRHPMCAVCGATTDIAEAGASRRCGTCAAQHFPRTDPAVIMLVVDDEDRCLLGHNAARGRGWFSTLAGFVEPGESPEQAVRREVMEETGVGVGAVRYAGSQPWPFPSSLMLGYFAEATSTEITVDGHEIDDARWFSRDELAECLRAGEVVVPSMISISGALLTRWYGAELPIPATC